MILLGSKLLQTPVMSLQTGSELAHTEKPVIDPATLKVLAYELKGSLLTERPSLLTIEDIREMNEIGMIVDSSDVFVIPNDVIKLAKVYELNFPLTGLTVRDEKRHKLGKVTDYTLDVNSFVVQQLIVKRPMLQSFNDTELVIHRSQIIEINNDAIVVHSEAKVPEPERREVSGSYINPFRNADPHGEQSR